MKRSLFGLLLGLNSMAVAALFVILFSQPVAQGGQRLMEISDLEYGSIDTNGDGVCNLGDDWTIEWLVNNQPQVLNRALEEATVNPDGGVDVSKYLLTLNAETIESRRSE